MNEVGIRKKRSDAANQLEFQMDCRARPAGIAMTNGEFNLESFGWIAEPGEPGSQ